MKRIIIGFMCVLLTACARAEVCNPVIEKGRVCDIYVGISNTELHKRFSPKIDKIAIAREGEEPGLRYRFSNTKFIDLEIDDKGMVWAIRIISPEIKTIKGIGVGSSYKAVIAAYPKAKLYYGIDEGGYLSLAVEEIGGYFSFGIKDLDETLFEIQAPPQDKLQHLKVDLVLIDS